MDEASRSKIYGLLALLFSKEISGELLDILMTEPDTGFWGEANVDLFKDFGTMPKAEILDHLAVEYSQIFIGPDKHLAPNESLYHKREDGQFGGFWGADTAIVKKIIESVGLEYKKDFFGMPDHISAELEFMQKLLQHHHSALQQDDQGTLEQLHTLEVWFLKNHLLSWIPEYCEKVIEMANLSLYKEVSQTTLEFLQSEAELNGLNTTNKK